MPRHPVLSRLAVVAAGALAVASCTTPVHSDPTNAPNALVSSLDRIRDAQARLGGPAPCLEEFSCAAGLTRVYGIQLGSGSIAFDSPAATVSALAAGAIDIGALPESAVEASDPRVTVLGDDRGMQPADNVVPVVAGSVVATVGAAFARSVDGVSATLDDAGLAGVDRALVGGASPELAAADWISHHPALGPAAPPPGAPSIAVGARPDPESTALADIYAAALTRVGWVASVVPVANRLAELQELERGQLALVPDLTAGLLQVLTGYTGTASTDQARNLVLVRAALADLGLVAFEPAPAKSADVFVVSSGVASALRVATLSDLGRAAGAHPPAPAAVAPLTKAQLAANTEAARRPVAPTLGVGSDGPQVVAAQGHLASLGYGVAARGRFDEATRRAVQAFQSDAGLIATGAIDPATARALSAARAPGSSGRAAPLPGDVNSLRPPALLGGAGSGTIYLVFANGPSGETPQIMDVLARYGAKATFFVEESGVAAAPGTLPQLKAAGHAIGITEWPHNGASSVAADVLARTASATQVAVSSVDGVTPTCFLAPYGSSDAASRARATSLGLRVVLWDLDPQDWRLPGPDAIASDLLLSARPGATVLLHDGGDGGEAVTALGQVLPELMRLGYNFAAIPGC